MHTLVVDDESAVREAVERALRLDGYEVAVASADDYLAKPFALEELVARLRALLRRFAPEGDPVPLRFADLSLDPVAHEI